MKKFQTTLGVLLGSLASLCVLNQFEARAADPYNLYTSEGQFISAITSAGVPYWQNTFTDLNGSQAPSYHATNATIGVSYTITAGDNGLEFVNPGGAQSVASFDGSSLLITFGPDNAVNAVGGNFFLTSGLGAVTGGSVSILLSDGNVINYDSPSFFHGFVTTGSFRGGVDILSLTISNPGNTAYPTLNDIIVAVEVPEPSVLALAGIGAAALLIFRRKK